jgi:hypothetical protein
MMIPLKLHLLLRIRNQWRYTSILSYAIIVYMRTSMPLLFWDVTWCRLVAGYQGFRTACETHIQGSVVKDLPRLLDFLK